MITNDVKIKKIMLVDDDKYFLEEMKTFLSDNGFLPILVSDPLLAPQKATQLKTDLILLDMTMPHTDGLTIKSRIENKISGIPIIFLSARNTTDDKIDGLNSGVDDYITKPFQSDELLARIHATIHRRQYYENLSMIDDLTGLNNRRFFNKEIEFFFNMSKRYQRIFSLAVIDVDNLKVINDDLGHNVGDAVLKKVAVMMKDNLRNVDIITRYGGDEFAIILPEITEQHVRHVLKRLLDKFENQYFFLDETECIVAFTISCGVVDSSTECATYLDMFKAADRDMYAHKTSKKNGDILL